MTLLRALLTDEPYADLSDEIGPCRGPCVPLTLYLPLSRRRVSIRRALIDTGSPVTLIYTRVPIYAVDANRDRESRRVFVGIDVADQRYYLPCLYCTHPFARGEEMLLGLDILENWLVTLDGRRRLLSLAHLDPDER